jgi:hypothetical protein
MAMFDFRFSKPLNQTSGKPKFFTRMGMGAVAEAAFLRN